MPYNRDIHSAAPLPNGGLPTDDELRRMVSRARRDQSEFIGRSFRRLFRRKSV
jgi:hypothetical protein